jgi:hypothetical protein
MRYDIEETAVYIQVRTVVWEDGAARPLLPDRGTSVPPTPAPQAPVETGAQAEACPTFITQ